MLCSCQLTPNTDHFTSPNSREWSTVSSKTDEEDYTTNGGGSSGVPLDLEIPNYDDQGQADFSEFFDYAYVSEFLSNAYTPA